MFHLVRSVNYGIINIHICQTEEVSYCCDNFLEYSPYSFRNRQLKRIFGCSLKEFSHRFVYHKLLYNGKNVILQRCQRCNSNLRSKVICLAFVHPTVPWLLYVRLLETTFGHKSDTSQRLES